MRRLTAVRTFIRRYWPVIVLLIGGYGITVALAGLSRPDEFVSTPPPLWTLIPFVVACVFAVLLLLMQRARGRWAGLLTRPPQRMRDASPYELGVAREAPDAVKALQGDGGGAPRYVTRDVDGRVRGRLADAVHGKEPSLVTVSGIARAGKTRTLVEALRAELGSAWLLIPEDAEALAQLARRPWLAFLGRVWVIWLDDIERFVRADDGLNGDTLTAFKSWRRPVVLVGTAGGKGARFIRGDGQRHASTQAALLTQHPPIVLPESHSETELDELDTVASDARQVIAAAGIGEFMLASSKSRGRLLLDVPSEKPALGFPRVASALVEMIAQSDPRFAIGIFGGWGSGKTTLMRAIERSLRDRDAVCVRFVAWRYEKEEHLIVPLLDTIREELVVWADAHGGDATARETAAAVGRVVRSIVAGVTLKVGVPGAMDVSFDANRSLQEHSRLRGADRDARVPRSFYHASFRALESAFEGFAAAGSDRRIAVFVDDLDRCLPENALQVLESMKLFFDLDGFVFIVGLDENVIEYAVESKYRKDGSRAAENGENGAQRISGREYIKKVFQLPYRLAPVAVDELGEFIRAASAEAGLPEEQRRELRRIVEPHLRFLVGDSAVNPREVKRYINLYTLQVHVNHELDPDVVLALQTLAFRREWEEVIWDPLLEFREEYLDIVRRRLALGGDAPAEFEDESATLPYDFLEYVTEGAPGEALLHVSDLDRYLSLGEAVRSTRSPALLEALGVLGQVRSVLNAASRHSRPDLLTGELETKLAQAETKVADEVSDTAQGQAVLKSIRALAQSLVQARARVDTADAAERERLLARLAEDATTVSRRLRRVYRAGDVAGPVAAEAPADVAIDASAPPEPIVAASLDEVDDEDDIDLDLLLDDELEPPPAPLPRVSELSPYALGVDEERIDTPGYVPREVDHDLDRALASAVETGRPSLIIVEGPAKAGKTRSLWEAVRRQPGLADAGLARPEERERLPVFLGSDRFSDPVVVAWLDDVERYAGPGQRDLRRALTLIGRRPARVIAVATARHVADEVAQHPQVAVIRLDAALSAAERETLDQSYPAALGERIAEYGLGATLVGMPELAERFMRALEQSPEGAAVVWAAVDWARAGMTGPIRREILEPLALQYLSGGTGKGFQRGLEWALESAIILRARDGGYRALDRIVDQADRIRPTVPAGTWEAVLSAATPEAAIAIGEAAEARGERDWAARAFILAERAKLPDISAAAGVRLGRLLAAAGEREEAEAAFRRAERRGNLDATVELGVLWMARGDVKRAEDAFHRADSRGHAIGAVHLGSLLYERKDLDGALEAFRRADERGVLEGTLGLAQLLLESGDQRAAEYTLRRALEQGSTGAALALAALLRERGELDEAEALLRAAQARGSLLATANLAVLHLSRGQVAEARDAHDRVRALIEAQPDHPEARAARELLDGMTFG